MKQVLYSVLAKQRAWDLGSILCFSNISSVCRELIVVPGESSNETCSGPGCGVGHVQDLDNTCTNVIEYTYDQQLSLHRTFTWAPYHIWKYFHMCPHNDPILCQ